MQKCGNPSAGQGVQPIFLVHDGCPAGPGCLQASCEAKHDGWAEVAQLDETIKHCRRVAGVSELTAEMSLSPGEGSAKLPASVAGFLSLVSQRR